MLVNRGQEGIFMVSKCANPGCGRPLHYLRDGRVFLFEHSVASAKHGEKRHRRFEHYWLCGDCAPCMTLVKDDAGVHVVYHAAGASDSFERSPRRTYPWTPE
jgi:hypothetical protein